MKILGFLVASASAMQLSDSDDQARRTAAAASTKWGVCCWDCSKIQFEDFPGQGNWNYNYRLFPGSTYPYTVAERYGDEFVPMLNTPWTNIQLNYNYYPQCSCVEGTSYPLCTLDDLSSAIELGSDYQSYKWLLGYNEPWNHMTVESAAKVWG